MSHDPQLKIIKPDNAAAGTPVISSRDFNVWHRDAQILYDFTVDFQPRSINCVIGPSGGGKSTFIRSINRINDGVAGFDHAGTLTFNNQDIHAQEVDINDLRSLIGMVFQKPCVFPDSIFNNVLFGRQDLKTLSSREQHHIVEENLRAVALWDETSHRLHSPARELSIGQQQRLCIARTLAVGPEVILFDEPTSALDPVSTRAIETLMLSLKTRYTIIFVTHNIQQARRIADYLVFICAGRIIEQGAADQMLSNPADPQTRNYLDDEFCQC